MKYSIFIFAVDFGINETIQMLNTVLELEETDANEITDQMIQEINSWTFESIEKKIIWYKLNWYINSHPAIPLRQFISKHVSPFLYIPDTDVKTLKQITKQKSNNKKLLKQIKGLLNVG